MRVETIYGELWVVKREPMSRLAQQVAARWNGKVKLSDAVKAIGESQKDEIVKLYKKFHDQYGYGNKIPVVHVIGSRTRLSECSDLWLSHHGINRDGSSMADKFRHFQEIEEK